MSFAPMRENKGTPKGGGVDPLLKGCFIGCFGLFAVVAIVVIAFVVNSSKSDPSQDLAMGSELSIRACERAVKEHLKAPATAAFSDVTSRASGSGWDVQGSVDAENGFGALTRSAFVCAATVTDEIATVTDVKVG